MPKLILCWTLQITLALILGIAAVAKLTGDPMSVETFRTLGMPGFGRYLVGTLELAAVLLLLVPSSQAWGAILTWGIMTGALIAHLTVLGAAGPMLNLTIFAALTWLGSCSLLYLRRNQAPLLRHMFDREDRETDATDEPVGCARE